MFAAVDDGAMQALGEIEDARDRILGHGEGAAEPPWGCDCNVTAPEIAAEQIAGARWALVKPFQSRRPRPQIERKGPTAEDDLRLRKQAIALFPCSRSGGS